MTTLPFILEHRGRGEVYLYSFFNFGARWGWLVNTTPQPLWPLVKDPLPIAQNALWAPGSVWKGAENLAPTGIRSPDTQPVASRYNEYVIQARSEKIIRIISYPVFQIRDRPWNECVGNKQCAESYKGNAMRQFACMDRSDCIL